jgi:hypothetical protein
MSMCWCVPPKYLFNVCVVFLAPFSPLSACFLGAFAWSRKGLLNFVVCVRSSVHLSVSMHQRVSHWTDFSEIFYWGLPWQPVEKLPTYPKSNKTRALHVNIEVRFIVAGDINSPQKHFCVKLSISILLTVTRTQQNTHTILFSSMKRHERATELRYTYTAFLVLPLKHCGTVSS